MASSIVKNKRDGKLVIKDGSLTPQTLELTFAEGDLSIVFPKTGEPIPIKDRTGALSHIKAGDAFADFGRVSFTFKYTDKDPVEALKCGTVAGNAWVSTASGDNTIPASYKTVDLEFTIYDQDGVTVAETWTITKVWFNPGSINFKEGDEANTVSAEGIVFGAITIA